MARGARGEVDQPGARARILETAERMFAERGYDATSTAKLAAEAGVPTGLVFYYFSTKLELLLAIVRERPTPQVVANAGRLRAGGTVRELLEAALDVLAAELDRHRYTRIIVFREAHLHPEIQARARQLIEQASAAVAHVVATGRDATDDTDMLTAVAELAVRSELIDAVLLHAPDDAPPRRSRAALEILAAAATRPLS